LRTVTLTIFQIVFVRRVKDCKSLLPLWTRNHVPSASHVDRNISKIVAEFLITSHSSHLSCT